MNNLDKYNKVFIESLSISEKKLNQDLKYNEIPEWDSIGHMSLVAAIEEEYKISLETDDIIDFSSYKKGIELLKKYNVNVA